MDGSKADHKVMLVRFVLSHEELNYNVYEVDDQQHIGYASQEVVVWPAPSALVPSVALCMALRRYAAHQRPGVSLKANMIGSKTAVMRAAITVMLHHTRYLEMSQRQGHRICLEGQQQQG